MTCEVVMVDAPLWLMGKAYLLGEVAVMPIAGYDVLLGMNWLTHNEATVVMTPGQQSLRLADGTTIPFSRAEKEPHDKYDDEAEGAAGLDDNRALLTIALDAGTMPEPLYFRAQPQTDDPPETRPTTPPWDSPHQHSDEDWADAVDAACSHMSGGGDEKAEMRGLIDEYRDIFSSQVDVFRPMSATPHMIHTMHDAPVGRRFDSSKLPTAKRQFLRRKVQELLAMGVIEPSTSLYSAAPVIAPKGASDFRLCHDFRKLNEITIPQEASLPTVDSVIQDLINCELFSRVDCVAGYFQMQLDPACRHMTAFTCDLGTFQYTVCPFGLRNLPASYNAAMASIFQDLMDFVKQYFDDLFIVSLMGTGLRGHLHALRLFFERCRRAGIQLSIAKCIFGARRIAALGFEVGYNALYMPSKAVEAITSLMAPSSPKDLQRFLGLTGYYRRFVLGYADVTLPLTELLRTSLADATAWCWTDAHQQSFDTLKAALASAPVLRIPVRVGMEGHKPFVLYTDASDGAVAAILSQTSQDDGQEHPCAFMSRKLTPAERNYTVTEREMLAVMFGIHCFGHLLIEGPFVVVTDHAALLSIFKLREPVGRIARWITTIQQYTFTCVHRAGTDHVNVDALTRLQSAPDLAISSTETACLLQSTIPFVDDVSSGRARPAQTQCYNGSSVLQLTCLGGHDFSNAPHLTMLAVVTRGSITGDIADQNDSNTPRIPSSQSVVAAPVWHEEVWLSTAVQQALRGWPALPQLPRRVREKVDADLEIYTAMFDDRTAAPLVIWKTVTQPDGSKTRFEVPPPSQRLAMIVEAHQWGHFGVRKTLDRLRRMTVWWVGIDDDVDSIVKRCVTCQRDAAHRAVFHAAQSIPIPHGVFDRVHMDLLSLPESSMGYTQLLLFVDALSKYPIGFPLRTKAASEVAAKLWSVICMFGSPTCIVSDNGVEFVNEVVNKLTHVHGIQRRLITSYRPQANGQVERFNRTVLSVLRKVCGDTPDMWPEWLEFVMLAIRTSTHAATGLSPFEVMFGRAFQPLANYTLCAWESLSHEEDAVLVKRSVEMQRMYQSAAHQAAEEAAVDQRSQQDKSHTVSTSRLPNGARVFIKVMHMDHKLGHRFDGPFFVVGESQTTEANANYRLCDESQRKLSRSFPRDCVFECTQLSVAGILSERQQRLYGESELTAAVAEIGAVEPGPLPGAPAGQEDPEQVEERWAVECLEGVDRRRKRVLVRWVGYPEVQWQPMDNFEQDDLDELISDFKRRQRPKRGRLAREEA